MARLNSLPTDASAIRMVATKAHPPSTYEFDFSAQTTLSNVRAEIPIATTLQDGYYVLVFAPYLSAGSIEMKIRADYSDFHLSSVTPDRGGNVGNVTVMLQGTGLSGDTEGKLVGPGGASVTGQLLLHSDTTKQFVTFNLRGLAAGRYAVQVERAGFGTVSLPNAFQITSGTGPRLEANLDAPQAVRSGRDYVLNLQYANVGDGDMAAPLFVVSANAASLWPLVSTRNATAFAPPQRLNELQLLGANQSGPAGVLPPGARFTIPIIFTGDARVSQMQFNLEVLRADDTAIDWNELETKLRPTNVDPALWAAVFANFRASVGNTWADYLSVLDGQANLLSRSGSPTFDHGQLLTAAIARATGSHLRQTLEASLDTYAPSPGLPMVFSRVALSGLEPRFAIGPLGRGWSHNFEYRLTQPDTNHVRLTGLGAGTRVSRAQMVRGFLRRATSLPSLRAAVAWHCVKRTAYFGDSQRMARSRRLKTRTRTASRYATPDLRSQASHIPAGRASRSNTMQKAGWRGLRASADR